MNELRVGVLGINGRVGKLVADVVTQSQGMKVAAALEAPGGALVGSKVFGVQVGDNLAAALKNADVWIDFTTAKASVAHAKIAAKGGVPIVIGTTGIDTDGCRELAEAARSVPMVVSPNMSLSANVLFDVVERMSSLLPDYDAEIVEVHHHLKKDSPSGTAHRLAESVRKGRGGGTFVHGREGLVGERKKEEIGVHAVRGGDVVGDHTVLFLGMGERIELVHRVTSRAAFAAGAVAAARWVVGRAPGLYDMRDVLGLSSKET